MVLWGQISDIASVTNVVRCAGYTTGNVGRSDIGYALMIPMVMFVGQILPKAHMIPMVMLVGQILPKVPMIPYGRLGQILPKALMIPYGRSDPPQIENFHLYSSVLAWILVRWANPCAYTWIRSIPIHLCRNFSIGVCVVACTHGYVGFWSLFDDFRARAK